ncbi:hypothetical protein WQ57_13710 [Mesobacillus campisalis]|uniref:N-acetylmuramoyl-L-alanine amidase n=1 Tax=Mesobacillus campisalis TaxID=1408103 RepID=A0A0M2SSE1_9BACI|nr:N-acetylmuramoyl-L-alanine amidase [Mesobacillus campisalis]KKK37494.1 hypothetical protein WQ57_13710 [Mesobacillus campisalis]
MKKALYFLFFLTAGCSVSEEVATYTAEDQVKGVSFIYEEELPAHVPGIPVTHSFLPGKNSKARTAPPTHIVIHFVSNALENPENPYVFEDIKNMFIDYEISSHYLITREGKIHQLVPESLAAFHAGSAGSLPHFPEYKNKLNDYSIGIELMGIGTESEMNMMVPPEIYHSLSPEHIGYTEEQYQALKTLTDDILSRNTQIKKDRSHIIGHSEYAPERKTDPGSLFNWSRLGL